MPSNFGNRFKSKHANGSSIHSRSNQPTILKSSVKQSDASSASQEVVETTIEEVKSRMSAVLDRMKSRGEEIGSMKPGTADITDDPSLRGFGVNNRSHNTELHQAASSTNAALAAPTGPSATTFGNDELARYKVQIIAVARNAEAKVREAEEKLEQIRSQLETAEGQRQAAEQRICEVEEFYKKRLSTMEFEGLKCQAMEETLRQVETSLKFESDARTVAERSLAEIRARVEEAAWMLNEAEKRRVEAEAGSRNAAALVDEIEARARASEKSARQAELRATAAERTVREIELVIYESDTIATELQKKCKIAEARLHQEMELRLFAEEQLKALADELNVNLEVDWVQLEADLAKISSFEQETDVTEDSHRQLTAQIEVERKARLEADRACEEAEINARKAQESLVEAEEKHAHAKTCYEDLLRQRPIDLHEVPSNTATCSIVEAPLLSGQAEVEFSDPTANLLMKMNESRLVRPAENHKNRILMMCYGSAALLSLIVLILLCIATYHQLGGL